MTWSHHSRWEFLLHIQCSRFELHTLLSAYYIYQVQEGYMCNKDCISTTMIKIDKRLVSSILSCQMNIKLINSKQYNSIVYSKWTSPSTARGKIKWKAKRRTKTDPVPGSVFYTLYSIFCCGILQKMYVLTDKLIWYQNWPIVVEIVFVRVWVWESK